MRSQCVHLLCCVPACLSPSGYLLACVPKPLSQCQGLCWPNICSLCCLSFCRGQRRSHRGQADQAEEQTSVSHSSCGLHHRETMCMRMQEEGLKVQLCLRGLRFILGFEYVKVFCLTSLSSCSNVKHKRTDMLENFNNYLLS